MASQAAKPHLAFISHRFKQNDGQGRVNYEVVKATLEAGYTVTVLATECSEDIASHRSCRFVRLGNDRLPTELLRNLVFASATAAWLRKHRKELSLVLANGFVTWERCEVVAAHFVHAAWSRSEWYPFRDFAPYSLYQRLYTALNVRWEKTAFLRAERVIAVSRPLVQELVNVGVPKDKIDVVWNGVNTEQFHPGPGDRTAFGLPHDYPVALFIGDIRTPRKNLDTVLRAMQRLPGLVLAVAGSKRGSPYPAMAAELGVADRVFFLDQVKQVPLLMRSVDIFVFPSRYEAHPLVLLEAMSSGLPSIVSGTFGAQEFLGGGGVILEDPNDPVALAKHISDLANDSVLRDNLSQASRQRALHMKWSITAEGYLAIFRDLLKRMEETTR